ncbi:ABC transporter ATP-binding protein [Filobacillus milosensis]|uniref:ABC transporter ATP-binding protein n=1 Tax=Filobacillus milosensis TaxID=94137 RepID=A0A4Y8ITL0_9BACI|nr:ABC transporter ATP-binding protein [Filobacillus milosensis]TFB24402.1 ABC transporter ATP-binding protein [Filobacillus milosensis]
MIRVSGVSKSIHKNQILKDVHFSVKNGTVTGLVGRNGAGKTTLLRMIAGILKPTNGEITVNDKNVFKQPSIKQNVVFVPDSADALKTYTISEIVMFYKEIYQFNEEYFNQLLEKFEFNKQGKIKHFSKGQKALFSLILAFSTNAKYILLDEPTDGLDVIIKKKILQFIAEEVAEKDVSVIISSHRLDELEKMADHIIVLKQGRVDSEIEMEELKSQYRKIQVAFETSLPNYIREQSEVLSESGRVAVLLIDSDDEKTDQLINDASPILYEDLPLTLEDIFIAKLGGELYVS